PLFAYLPPRDPLLKKKAVTQLELSARELWVMPEGHCFRSQVLSYCGAEEAVSPAGVRFESGSFETVIHLVDGGMGATILPSLVGRGLSRSKRDAQVRPLASPTPVREIGLVTARADLRRRVARALAQTIRERLEVALGPEPRRAVVLDPRA